MGKILYVASTVAHLRSFHEPYISALRERGHEVFTMARGEGVDFDVPFEKKLLSPKNGECRRRIRRIVNDGGFDFIILNTSLAAFHVRAALSRRNRPTVLNIMHGYLFPFKNPASLKGKVKRLLLLLAERIVKGRTDAVMTMNSEDTAIALKYKLSSGAVLECRGMGIPPAAPRRRAEEIRAEMRAENAFVMTFVGEYSGRKNQEYLISLMPKIRERIPEAVLWLIGEGDERANFERMIADLSLSDSVKLVGRRSDAIDFMRASDIYVSASRSEGLPFNIVEALGAGCDVVASDVKGQRDILEDGAGVLCDLADSASFVDAIEGVAKKRIVIDEVRKCEAYATYSIENVFSDTLSMMIEVGFPDGENR